MTDSTLVFGADGGGTKTLGVLADASGTELARMQVGPGNPNVAGVDIAARNLLELIGGCCELAQTFPARYRLGGVRPCRCGKSRSCAGNCRRCCRRLLLPRGWSSIPMTLETDARIALEGAFGGGPGIVLIAGTGSNVIGKLPDGDSGLGRRMGARAGR